MRVLDQCPGVALVVADTMDYYIQNERDSLLVLLRRIDGLVLNDSEAKLLTGDENLVPVPARRSAAWARGWWS